MEVIKWDGNWTSCRAVLVWNHTCDFNRTRAEITRMISDQIALHSVELPLLTHIRAFPTASQIPRHAKAYKFKRPLSQNEEPFGTKTLFK